jgi:formylglycine-generating enzyme required for sulfatase activity
MNERDELDPRLEIEALEKLIAARAGGNPDDLEAFGKQDAVRGEAVRRAKEAAAMGSTKPEPPEFPGPEGVPAAAGKFGAFRLIEELGRGGQGEVWLAQDSRLRRRVALKILHRGVAASDDALLRFRREAEIASKLDHPGLCAVFDVGREQGRAWMAMRYVEGETVAKKIAARLGRPGDADAIAGWVKIVEDTARAVHAAHEVGVVHRDLKPSNVVVGKDGAPVVLDFGLARDEGSGQATLTAPGAVFGTPAFMAPEQLLGHAVIDRRADVFALGAVLFQALTGRLPREGPTFEAIRAVAFDPIPSVRKLNPAVSEDLAVVVATALAPDLGLRYRTAADFADDLRRVRDGEPVRARPVGPLLRLRSWAKRNKALAAATFGAFAALAVGLAFSLHFGLGQARALAQRDQVADLRNLRRLLDAETRLYPIGPEIVDACATWLDEAAIALARQVVHESARTELRGLAKADASGQPTFVRVEDAYYDDVLGEVLDALSKLRGRVDSVRERRSRALTLRERSVEGPHKEAWIGCAARVAADARFKGFRPAPIPGLVPLGPNPQSKLEEFWHVETGSEPTVDAKTGERRVDESSGVVLVLLPGGSSQMGARDDDDAADRPFEAPLVDVVLDPYLIAKFELTQGQWIRIAEGANPAYYFPGTERGKESAPGEDPTLGHPVEFVSRVQATEVLGRVGMTLPTEAQWEFACRAGSETPWFGGEDRGSSAGHCNVAGLETRKSLWTFGLPPAFRDAHRLHAKVGSYAPNAFGIFDMQGNVAEWCRDDLLRNRTGAVPQPGDGLLTVKSSDGNGVIRGGSFQLDVTYARSSARFIFPRDATRRDIGVRPSAAIRGM